MPEAAAEGNDAFGIVGTVQARVFHVERAVAEGGFGVVYRAFHDVFRSPVALKCLKVPDTLTDAQRAAFLERFRGEAELLFRLSAALPEVVRPLQFGVLETEAFVPFLALEWLEGVTLDRFVKQRQAELKPALNLSQALELLSPIARVLWRAHQFGDKGQTTVIIHRDVKPENVFLARQGEEVLTRILDFGIAKVKADTSAIAGRATGADAINAFSPAYAAPEQWAPETYGACGPWTDVYGLALTLTETLIGRPPIFGELTAMMGSAFDLTLRPTPRTKGAKISDAAEKAFARALAVDPRERLQSIEAFWTQLERSVGREPSLTRRPLPSLQSVPPPPNLELGLPEPPAAPASARPSEGLASPLAAPAFGASPLQSEPPPASFDLQVAPQRSRPRPARAGEAPGVWTGGAIPSYRSISSGPSKTLGQRFGGAAWLLVLAAAVGGADLLSQRMTGERLMLGPLRPLYVAAPLAVLGIIVAFYRAVEE